MSGFNLAARNLLNNSITKPSSSKTEDEILEALEAEGFDNAGLIREYRSLLDNTTNEAIKARILSDIAKIKGVMNPDTAQRDIPQITINVFGDNTRVAAMLCPPSGE